MYDEAKKITDNHVYMSLSFIMPMVFRDPEEGDEIFLKFARHDEEYDIEEFPLEFWAVSDWLGNSLREHGETVVEVGNAFVWGRHTSGQALYADGVIQKIYEEKYIGEYENEYIFL